MAEHRRFARLSVRPSDDDGTFAIPADGMCLSAYLLLRPRGAPGRALLGRVDPSGPWPEVAALDARRLARIGDRWVLPATQLLFFEAPDAAALRIARELLGRTDLAFGTPQLFSEAYARKPGATELHWDLQFVYSADWPEGAAPPWRTALWRELRFVDVGATPADAFGRGHGDILALAGLPPRPPS